ncbi:uncharacterized protein ptchd1 isoform X2 [Stigmatopora argus]
MPAAASVICGRREPRVPPIRDGEEQLMPGAAAATASAGWERLEPGRPPATAAMLRQALHAGLSGGFRALGRSVAGQPVLFASAPLLLAVLLGASFSRYRVEDDVQALLAPKHSLAKIEGNLVDSLFPLNHSKHALYSDLQTPGRYGRVIVAARRGNLLESPLLDDVLELHRLIYQMRVTAPPSGPSSFNYSFSHLCLPDDKNACIVDDVIRALEEMAAKTDANRSAPAPPLRYPITSLADGRRAYIGHQLGGVQTWPGDGQEVRSARALQLTYYLRARGGPTEGAAAQWEEAFCARLRRFAALHPRLALYPATSASLRADFQFSSVLARGPLLAGLGLCGALAVLCCSMRDCVRSKPWLGVLALLSVALAGLTAAGILNLSGSTYNSTYLGIPFVVLGHGLFGSFEMLSSWRRTREDQHVRERVASVFGDVMPRFTGSTALHLATLGLAASPLTNMEALLPGPDRLPGDGLPARLLLPTGAPTGAAGLQAGLVPLPHVHALPGRGAGRLRVASAAARPHLRPGRPPGRPSPGLASAAGLREALLRRLDHQHLRQALRGAPLPGLRLLWAHGLPAGGPRLGPQRPGGHGHGHRVVRPRPAALLQLLLPRHRFLHLRERPLLERHGAGRPAGVRQGLPAHQLAGVLPGLPGGAQPVGRPAAGELHPHAPPGLPARAPLRPLCRRHHLRRAGPRRGARRGGVPHLPGRQDHGEQAAGDVDAAGHPAPPVAHVPRALPHLQPVLRLPGPLRRRRQLAATPLPAGRPLPPGRGLPGRGGAPGLGVVGTHPPLGPVRRGGLHDAVGGGARLRVGALPDPGPGPRRRLQRAAAVRLRRRPWRGPHPLGAPGPGAPRRPLAPGLPVLRRRPGAGGLGALQPDAHALPLPGADGRMLRPARAGLPARPAHLPAAVQEPKPAGRGGGRAPPGGGMRGDGRRSGGRPDHHRLSAI